MSAHTPGPWRVGPSGPNQCLTIGTANGLMVAMVSHGHNHPTEANAKLIAAAPALADQLDGVLACALHDANDPVIDSVTIVVSRERVKAARSALRAAGRLP